MKDDKPLVTWGFHHYFHGDLTKDDLDLISSERPILVMHRSYHEFILNTPALEYFEITRDFVESLDEEARMYADFDKGHFSEQGMISSLSKVAEISWKARILIIWFAVDRRLLASKWRDNDCQSRSMVDRANTESKESNFRR